MARRRRKQEDISIIPVLGLLVFGLWASIQNSQWNLALILGACLLIAAVIIALILMFERKKKERIRQSGIAEIDKMSGIEFETYLKLLLERRGYTKVKLTTTYDLGVDLIAMKDGLSWAIQAKRYKSSVGLDAVRQVVAARNHYKCDKSMVITNSYFTSNAKAIAKSADCVLIDRDLLVQLITQSDFSK